MIYFELFITFLKIGAFTFGGGYAMLPLIQDEVLKHNWLSLNDIIDFIAVSESTPGPFAINIATYVGIETGGFFGAMCATTGVVLPSFVIILFVAKYFMAFRTSAIVQGVMVGLKPTVIGLISSAVLSMAMTVFIPQNINISYFISVEFISSVIILILGLILAFKKVSPILIIVLSAIVGIAVGYGKELF